VSTGSDIAITQTDGPRAGASRVVLTALLACALAVSVLAALVSTFFILYAGWPRSGVLNGGTPVLLIAWAPIVVTSVVALRHRREPWWTPSRLALALVAVGITTAAGWFALFRI
jgi:hypothetical protein